MVTGQTFVAKASGITVFSGAVLPFMSGLEVPLDEGSDDNSKKEGITTRSRLLSGSVTDMFTETYADRFAKKLYANPHPTIVNRESRFKTMIEIRRASKNGMDGLAILNNRALEGFPGALKAVRKTQLPVGLDRSALTHEQWTQIGLAARLGSSSALEQMLHETFDSEAKAGQLVVDLMPLHSEFIRLDDFAKTHAASVAGLATDHLGKYLVIGANKSSARGAVALLKLASLLREHSETKIQYSQILSGLGGHFTVNLDSLLQNDPLNAIPALLMFIDKGQTVGIARDLHERILLALRDVDVLCSEVPLHIVQAIYENFNNKSAFLELWERLQSEHSIVTERDAITSTFRYVIQRGSLSRARELVDRSKYGRGPTYFYEVRDAYRERLMRRANKPTATEVQVVSELLHDGITSVASTHEVDENDDLVFLQLGERAMTALVKSELLDKEHLSAIRKFASRGNTASIWVLLKAVNFYMADKDPVKAGLAVYAAEHIPTDFTGQYSVDNPTKEFNEELHSDSRRLFLLRDLYDAYIDSNLAAKIALQKIAKYNGGLQIGDIPLLDVLDK